MVQVILLSLLPVLLGLAVPADEAPSADGAQIWKLSENVEPDPLDLGEMVARADSDRNLEAAFTYRLLAANRLLAFDLQPCASRLLLGIPEEEDYPKAREVIAQVTLYLEQASGKLGELDSQSGLDEYKRYRYGVQLETLQAFSKALRELWLQASIPDEQRRKNIADATVALGVILESDDPAIVRAATLWQAYLFASIDKLQRALDLLPTALKPVPEGKPVSFYARVLRCRYIAQLHEDCAVSVSLLLRMKSRCGLWFEDEERAQTAQQVVKLITRRLCEDSLARANPDRKEFNEWCAGVASRIDGEFSEICKSGPVELLSLGSPVPMIIEVTPSVSLEKNSAKPEPAASPAPAEPQS